MQSLNNANIYFNQQGTPVATDFDDIYFSNDGGLAETEYVFLKQNGLPERWQQSSSPFFHIIETGFGTGANFLMSWQRFRQFREQQPDAPCRKLYFSSFEKYPLTLSDLTRALQTHTVLSDLCQQLLAYYPPAIPGCHRLVFDNGSVTLDLWLGDVNELLPQLPESNQADAFFLDGFAPGKNPDMWQPNLFEQMARLSHQRTTVATFSCAGLVKHGLQQHNFLIKKVKGFGRKREMLTASYIPALPATDPEPARGVNGKVAIIGGGIASVCLALQLVKKGVNTELICADPDVAQGASHNLQGAVYPNLHPTPTLASLLHCQAFYFARNFYQQLSAKGLSFALQWCGVLHLASNPELAQRQQKLTALANWPVSLVYPVSAEQASNLAGVTLRHSGIFLPQAGWLSPQQFCQAALTSLQQSGRFEVKFNKKVCGITPGITGAEPWQLQFADHSPDALYSSVVLANGADITEFAVSQHLPVNRVRGQVSHVESPQMQPLKTVLCHKGYITPALNGCHAVGATFDRVARTAYTSDADNQENLALVNSQLQQPSWFADARVSAARAAFRATVPDHLPIMGAAAEYDGLYMLGGLGARGILLAPLLAETLACQLAGQPLPLSTVFLRCLAPDRFKKIAKD
ncbi:bifunctional tRNA (5-methylaminomethyl-2-thiouridine)(34)-methyltransferase MnmD/FAD-dependent 5-carboxymethylaminomethyl-2-thiouridine(34) oxidoreductase MnmC [Arsukibacterium sp.]|uniref:bifunctional tRNA (5-methylaminomethyl-2-thiouridine)(34)-methyltransferase MnmD/FAD-dependent 5-carboxymethylaminomethyl-2-thiouridine(34) oxidoreductase MnmC n=1 Tax=Arsukibacterium sp. TaxID=1977258 RepID=UPI00299E2CB7|nr:bifunctional tRNA (5-methylaminomethyl-2-thiouridine)(34)-methyltransferase MnmD/FAD-dependent 5-carboxymethylaminomethyl-2-thiouridine(34) oxidoreductase MnmC [Arsukibacterium sp.]MDX1676881.1 bifunctional tRNA (5-methylaminomethyl-2-thiouridine)(34)-methyltransferase MnmD/FAD-dependent 5-carboxymethylaminomethyl-2-thiouridine(34) oxidoreductase MnmC [Arsukibacterium sp.]